VPSAGGFVLAGGASRRFGSDKALLPWPDGPTLLDHAVRRLARVCADVTILSGRGRRYPDRGIAEILDAPEGDAPLAGILAALEATPHPFGLFLAVDLPLVPEALLRHLVHLAVESEAVVPVMPKGPEPLCAAYSRSCVAAIRGRVAAADWRMTSFWTEVSVRTVTENELRRFGDPGRIFLNLNTSGDYEGALRLAESDVAG
jgi:molybdopterin-guanine dinucleotide biosynthesis protein A